MTAPTEAESLRFVERSPSWLRYGGAVVLLVVAAFITAGAVIESIWGFYPVAAFLALAALWQWRLAKVTIMVEEQLVTLTGPAWKQIVQRQYVQEVSVAPDNGMNLGLVNWPVTTHEHGSLTRLNMGGSTAVTFSDSNGHRYQFVLTNPQDAKLIAEAIAG